MMSSARAMTSLVTLLCLVLSVSARPGTTANLKEIFLGRCWEYEEVTSRANLHIVPRERDCNGILAVFLKAFEGKDPYDVTVSDYEDFFEATKQTNLPENKLLLWTGTQTVAHEYGNQGHRYVTLEDSLMGYLVNGLNWCGTTEAPGINYDSCPDYADLPAAAAAAFWGGASQAFARYARGDITLMLNGSNPTRRAYDRSSFFAKYELPNLQTSLVEKINIVLVHDIDKPHIESCGAGSLLDLYSDIQARSFRYSCQENPKNVLFLLCVDKPDSQACEDIQRQKTGSALRKLLSMS